MMNASFTFSPTKYGKNNTQGKLRWNNCKESDRKFLRGEEIQQKSLHEHFSSDGHQSFEDVNICLTDKTDPSEYYRMRTLKTLHTKET